MSQFITKEKVKEIVSGAPQGTGKDVFNALVTKGYEIEGYNAEFSFGETLSNIPPSGAEFVKAIWSAVTSPIQTVSAMSSLGLGAMRKGYTAITGNQLVEGGRSGSVEDEKMVDGMVEFFVDRYGSKDKILNTIEKDPVGFLADAASAVGGAGLALKGASVGGKVSTLAKAGGALSKYSRALEPTTLAVKTARKLNEVSGINKLIPDS